MITTVIGIGAFFVTGLVVSIRLLGLWMRTRELPELLIAIALLGIGPLGFCVMTAGLLLLKGTSVSMPIFYVGLVIQAVGFFAAAYFTWKVFRPDSPIAQACVWGLGVGLALCVLLLISTERAEGTIRWSSYLDVTLKTATMLWASSESLVYWRRMQRRISVGLADRLTANRFLLWGAGIGAGAVGFLIQLTSMLTPGTFGDLSPVLSLCGLVSALGLWLAFLPPPFYRRWLATGPAQEGL